MYVPSSLPSFPFSSHLRRALGRGLERKHLSRERTCCAAIAITKSFFPRTEKTLPGLAFPRNHSENGLFSLPFFCRCLQDRVLRVSFNNRENCRDESRQFFPLPLFARINFRDGGKVKRMDCRLALFSWKKSSRSERNGSSALSSLGIPRVRRREGKSFSSARTYIYIYTWTRAELHASCNSARPVVFYADLNHILEE